MAAYYTKEELYSEIYYIRNQLGFSHDKYPLDMVSILKEYEGLKIQEVPFSIYALRGMVSFGDENSDDIILLNSSRSCWEQNFDCTHEMLHLIFHRKDKGQVFFCTDTVRAC